jgi:tetratricopeptide (TPR) repeat protein
MFWRAGRSRIISIALVMSKPGRNDPCPCGSGKKYKKCCLSREEAARTADLQGDEPFITELRPDLDEAVDRALQRLEQGEGKRVKSEITELLEQNPDYHLTNYAMGVYQAMVEQAPAAAVLFFEKAVAILPPFPEAHFNLANAARGALDIPKAVAAYRAAVRYSQDDGIAELARKELQRLEEILLKATPFPSLDAYLANARLFDRAFECLSRRQFDQATGLFQRVLSDNPRHVQSHGNLALAYAGLGRRADAIACFDRALELDPDYEPAILNRRITLNMREGEPFIPDAIESVEYYTDRVRSAAHAKKPDM